MSEQTAKRILRDGFRDGMGHYMTEREWTGVWVSNVPLDANEGMGPGPLIELLVNLTRRQISKWEWVEKGKGYREWLIPAKVLNSHILSKKVRKE